MGNCGKKIELDENTYGDADIEIIPSAVKLGENDEEKNKTISMFSSQQNLMMSQKRLITAMNTTIFWMI